MDRIRGCLSQIQIQIRSGPKFRSRINSLLLDNAKQESLRAADFLHLLATESAFERILALLDGKINHFDETI